MSIIYIDNNDILHAYKPILIFKFFLKRLPIVSASPHISLGLELTLLENSNRAFEMIFV